MRNRINRKAAALAAGVLSCALMIGAMAGDTANVAYALEEAEAKAAMDSIDDEPLTEAPEDELLSAVTQSVVESLSTDDAEGLNPLLLLPKETRQILNSLDEKEIESYVIMIDRILKNPDFQAIMQYDEVRDLIVTLVHDGLNMAQEDPVMTNKILTTLGVDRRLIMVFLAILEERAGNPAATEMLSEFMKSDKGELLIDQILKSVDQVTIEGILKEFQSKLGDGTIALTALLEAAPENILTTPAAGPETETESRQTE